MVPTRKRDRDRDPSHGHGHGQQVGTETFALQDKRFPLVWCGCKSIAWHTKELLLVLKQLVASDRDASHGHAKDAQATIPLSRTTSNRSLLVGVSLGLRSFSTGCKFIGDRPS